MSKSLSPIHYWLYNKIKIHEGLELEIIKEFKREYCGEVESISLNNTKKFGERLTDKPLEEIIDQNNIHSWLQNKIKISETRQAAILGNLFAKYKKNGIMLAENIFNYNSIKWGRDASNKYKHTTAKDIYNILNNYILDGMPCDKIKNITKSYDNYLEYTQTQCLHKDYWKRAKVNPSEMYNLRTVWIGGFVNTLAPDFKYQVSAERIGDTEGFVHRIFKK